MFKILRPKVLLFFVVSIMSFCITSEKSYAAEQGYFDVVKKSVISAGSYCQQKFNQTVDYLHGLFLPRAIIHSVTPEDVKIQIMGKRVTVVDDEDMGDEGEYEQDDVCSPGDIKCEKNLNFFNSTFFGGLLDLNDQSPTDIDRRDNEYRKMRIQQLSLLYGTTSVKPATEEFDYSE